MDLNTISSEFHDAISPAWFSFVWMVTNVYLSLCAAFRGVFEFHVTSDEIIPRESGGIIPAAVETTIIFSFEGKYWRNRG